MTTKLAVEVIEQPPRTWYVAHPSVVNSARTATVRPVGGRTL